VGFKRGLCRGGETEIVVEGGLESKLWTEQMQRLAQCTKFADRPGPGPGRSGEGQKLHQRQTTEGRGNQEVAGFEV